MFIPCAGDEPAGFRQPEPDRRGHLICICIYVYIGICIYAERERGKHIDIERVYSDLVQVINLLCFVSLNRIDAGTLGQGFRGEPKRIYIYRERESILTSFIFLAQVMNLLGFVSLNRIDAGTFAVIQQSKIFFTALFQRAFLGRTLSQVRIYIYIYTYIYI